MKKVLIVVDMQKDFVDGALGPAEAVGIVDNVVKKIESKRDIRAQGDGIGAGFGKNFLKLFLEKSSLGYFW